MIFTGISYLAVIVAAIAGFVFGMGWYMLFGKQWMAAIGMKEQPKPTAAPFIIAFVSQLVMAWLLAGLIGHLGEVTVAQALITAASVWVGFVLMTMIVNHRFQGSPWSLTAIDSGHWLGVLLAMGLIIGLFGV